MRGLGCENDSFVLLKQHKDNDENVLRDDDLRPLLDEIVSTHRGLRFRTTHPNFRKSTFEPACLEFSTI